MKHAEKMAKLVRWGSMMAFVSTIFISSYSTFTKILLNYFSTYSLAAIAQIFSVLTLLFFFGAIHEFKELGKLPYKIIWALVMVGILSSVIQPLFLFQGLLKTSAINGALISRTQMVMVSIISTLWLREKVTPAQIWGTFIMFGGAWFIATKGLTNSVTLYSGDFLLFISAFIGAVSTNIFKRYLEGISPRIVVLTRNTLGVILNLTIVPFIFSFQHDFNPVFQAKTFMYVAAFAFCVIIGAQYLWYKAVEIIPANRASTIGMTSPVFGVLFAMLILNEKLLWFHVIGAIMILIGLAFATLHQQEQPSDKNRLKAKQWTH